MILTLILILMALLGVPLFVVIVTGALVGFYQAEIDLVAVIIEFYRLAEMPVLLAIPLFSFAGYMLSESQAPKTSGCLYPGLSWLGPWWPGDGFHIGLRDAYGPHRCLWRNHRCPGCATLSSDGAIRL